VSGGPSTRVIPLYAAVVSLEAADYLTALIIPVTLMHYSWNWHHSIFKQSVIFHYFPSKRPYAVLTVYWHQAYTKQTVTQKLYLLLD